MSGLREVKQQWGKNSRFVLGLEVKDMFLGITMISAWGILHPKIKRVK